MAKVFYPLLQKDGGAVSAGTVERTNAAAIAVSGMYKGNVKAGKACLPAWDEGGTAAFRSQARKAAAELLAECISASTRAAYKTAFRKFYAYCFLFDIDLVAWLHEIRAARGERSAVHKAADMVVGFLAWAKQCRVWGSGERLLNPGSLAVYGYGACKLIEEVGGIFATEDVRLRKLLRKLKKDSRLMREQGLGNKKLPLVAELIVQLQTMVGRHRAPGPRTRAYMDACELMFFFAFRVSEVLLTARYNRFDPDRHLCVGNIVIYRRRRPGDRGEGDMVEVSRRELLEPGIRGQLVAVKLSIGPATKVRRARIRMHFRTTKGPLCPVLAAFRVKVRAVKLGLRDQDMAFQVKNGRRRVCLRGGSGPARAGPNRGRGGSGFRGWLHKGLERGPRGRGCYLTTATGRVTVDPYAYSAHSPRAGFATTLFAAGEDPLVVKDLGDWRSWAVLGYRFDDADRFKGKSDVLASFLYTAPPVPAAGS